MPSDPSVHVYVHAAPTQAPAHLIGAAIAAHRLDEHRRGLHDGYGNARRDCPLCVR